VAGFRNSKFLRSLSSSLRCSPTNASRSARSAQAQASSTEYLSAISTGSVVASGSGRISTVGGGSGVTPGVLTGSWSAAAVGTPESANEAAGSWVNCISVAGASKTNCKRFTVGASAVGFMISCGVRRYHLGA
jgi:hypothetical protein